MENLPKYKLLADLLRQEISSGKYKYLDRLLTENELAQKYNMSRQTVRQAIGLLEKEGIITRRRGSGTYISKPGKTRQKTMTVGVISTYITEYIFPSIVRGIEGVLTENGYSLLLSATRNRVDSERKLLLDCIQKNVDGLIVEGTKTTLPNPNISLYREIRDMGVPIVFINGFYPEMTDSVYVVMDDFGGGLEAVRRLISQGYSNIAGIFKSDDMQGHKRYAGFTRGLIEAGISLADDSVVWYGTETMDMIFEEGENSPLSKAVKNAEGVVCYNDLIAVRLIDFIQKTGRRVPEDVKIVSFDNSHYSELGIVKIISLNHPKEELGKLAAQKLLNMINGRNERPSVLPWGIDE